MQAATGMTNESAVQAARHADADNIWTTCYMKTPVFEKRHLQGAVADADGGIVGRRDEAEG